MKPLKIKYAKAVFMSIGYILLIIGVFVVVTKLSGVDITLESVTLMIATSAILLHFMDKETQEHRKEEEDER